MQDIPQGECGDQGDPVMPLLFSLAMHPSLVSTGDLLREGEKLFAFLDDVYSAANQRGCWRFSVSSRTHCGSTPGSACIAARRNSGTAVGPHPEDARISQSCPRLECQMQSFDHLES